MKALNILVTAFFTLTMSTDAAAGLAGIGTSLLRLEPSTTTTVCRNGELRVDSAASNVLKICRSNAWKRLSEIDGTETLTNKTIDAASNTISNIANANISSSAAIARSKIATGTASHVLINDGSGNLSSESALAISRGGTNNGSLSVSTGGVLYTDGTKIANTGVGTSGQVLQSNGSSTPTWVTPASSLVATYDLLNCSISTSVASSALTVALKDVSGSDPSAGSPCKIAFRNATASTGAPSEISATAATSVVVSNGSAVGCTASVSCTIYVYAINNGGTIELGVIGQSTLDDGALQTSTAEGGSGAADSTNVLYSTTARTSKPVRLLGRIKITPGASFAWSSNATELANVPFTIGGVFSNATTTIERIERANIANNGSACSVSSQSGAWVASVTRNGAGDCSVNFATGIFSATPVCECTHSAGGPCEIANVSSSVFQFRSRNTGGTATDAALAAIICMGPK